MDILFREDAGNDFGDVPDGAINSGTGKTVFTALKNKEIGRPLYMHIRC